MTIYTFIILAIVVGYILAKDATHEMRVGKLLNRLMARNFQEYEYFEKKYDKDIAVEKKVQEVQIETVAKATQAAQDAAKAVEDTEEDWGEEV